LVLKTGLLAWIEFSDAFYTYHGDRGMYKFLPRLRH
jgi:hypothetical protein